MQARISGVDSLLAPVAAIASHRKVSLMRANYAKVHVGSALNFSGWVEWRKFETGTTGPPPKEDAASIETRRGR
jgi:hypothetical protein